MIQLLIAHPSRLVCETIAAVIKDDPNIIVSGYATSAAEAMLQLDRCNMILISTRLPHNGALELLQTAGNIKPDIKTLVMGMLESEQAILKYIEAGAAGYVLKKESTSELLKNIYAAYQHKAFVSPKIAALLMARITELAGLWPETGSRAYDSFDLTPREREVLELLGQGLSNREIADQLVIEVGTVKNHVHNILKKLDLSSRRDVVTYMMALEQSI